MGNLILVLFLLSIKMNSFGTADEMQSLPKLLDAATLHKAIKSAQLPLRVLDCSFVPKPRPPLKMFRMMYWGKFAEQAQTDPAVKESRALYEAGHIPGSVHFDLSVATQPTEHEKFAHYPPEVFGHYAQLLGLNSGDHLVFYGRGPMGGMLFASRAYWLFRSYGHSGGLSLLDGGLEEWLTAKLPIEKPKKFVSLFPFERGNWTAELTLDGGKRLNSAQWTLLDARPGDEFAGRHLATAQSIPAKELVQENCTMKSFADLKAKFCHREVDIDALQSGKAKKPLVTLCNSGMQASMLATAIDVNAPGLADAGNLRVYTGSMLEMQARAPALIEEGQKKD